MEQQKKKSIFHLVVFLLILFIVGFTLKSSLEVTFQELKETPFSIVFNIFLLGVFYQIVEGFNISKLANFKDLQLSAKEGFEASCYTAFMRVITFGSGTMLSEIWYYHKKRINMPYAIGLTLSRLLFYKLSLISWGILGLFLYGNTLYENKPSLFFLALVGIILTGFIVAFLISLAYSIHLQVFLVVIGNRFLKKAKWRDRFDSFNLQIYALRDFFVDLLKNKSLFMKCLLLNIFKVCLWLIIPGVLFQVPFFSYEMVFFFFLTTFSFLTAGILPAPAGMGSLEFVFLLFFPLFISEGKGVSALILLRFASYFLPFFMGFIVSLKLKKESLVNE